MCLMYQLNIGFNVVVSGNELIRTWTLVFTTEENYNEFLNELQV